MKYQLSKRCLEGRLEGFKVSSWFLNIMKLVEYRIAKKWVLESGIQLKESGIPFTIGIQNPNSTHKVRNPVYLQSGIDSLETKIQDCLGFSYMGQKINHMGFSQSLLNRIM